MQYKHQKINKLTTCGLFTALICLCSWITLPTAVPVTLQTFGIFLSVGVLGGKNGFVSVVTYIMLGIVGLPVFAGFQGGAGVLLGASGGYTWGFLVAVGIMWLLERLFGKSLTVFVISEIVAILVCYALGSVWYFYIYAKKVIDINFVGIISTCVLPFVLPDFLKITLATVFTKKLRKLGHKIY